MEQNNSPDELIEITSDAAEDEDDVRIYVTSVEGAAEEASGAGKDENADPGEGGDLAAADQSDAETVNGQDDAETADGQDDAETVEDLEGGSPEAANDGAAAADAVTEEPEEVDDYAEDILDMEREEADREIVEAIGNSIAEQVDSELENSMIFVPLDTEEAEGPGQDGPDGNPSSEEENDDRPAVIRFFAGIPWWGYMIAGVALVLIIMTVWVFSSGPGRNMLVRWGSRYAAGKVSYEPVGPVEEVEVPDETGDDLSGREDLEIIPTGYSVIAPGMEAEPTQVPEDPEEPAEDIREVYNILLIGEENMGDSARGRTDLIMIATINRAQGEVKLTSVMRDCLVAIPGHLDNRINVAYTIGGVSLLYETLKNNLGAEFDNYILVDFDSFEDIIDAVGGVDVELSTEEARYLNTTNYISIPEYRTVSAGGNHLNGNQALGYCRIRAVGTSGGEYSDFGRTTRQRNVLNSLYASAAQKNYFELLGIADRCLPYVRTDLTAEDIEKYIGMILDIGMDKGISNYRIPVSGSYSDVLLRDMLVTKIDLEVNTKALSVIIYGEEEQQ